MKWSAPQIQRSGFVGQSAQAVAKLREALVGIPSPRNQFAFPVRDIRERPKTVVLQLEQKLWVVERLADERKRGGVDAWKAHIKFDAIWERVRPKRMKSEVFCYQFHLSG